MQAAVPEGKGAMLAVMGLDMNELNSKIKKFDKKKDICEIANDNSPGQIILSGDKQTLIDLSNDLKAEKKVYIFASKRSFSLYFNETSC